MELSWGPAAGSHSLCGLDPDALVPAGSARSPQAVETPNANPAATAYVALVMGDCEYVTDGLADARAVWPRMC